jgi:hypothetical protein
MVDDSWSKESQIHPGAPSDMEWTFSQARRCEPSLTDYHPALNHLQVPFCKKKLVVGPARRVNGSLKCRSCRIAQKNHQTGLPRGHASIAKWRLFAAP